MSFKIVLVIGAARSGSTLLGMKLGTLPRCSFHGELNHFWDRGLDENHLCGCGLHFQDCDFWKIIRSAVPIEPKEGASFKRELAGLLAREYSINPLGKTPAPAARPAADIMANIKRLYEQIAQVTGAEWIIDTSKQPIYARLLIDIFGADRVQVIHLVRDARGVAYSMAKRRLKIDAGQEQRYMVQRGAVSSCYGWVKVNLSAMKLRREVESYIRISYEDFCAAPAETVGVLDKKFFKVEPSLVNSNLPDLSSHTVSGNPIRIKGTHQKATQDTEWKHKMAWWDRLTVTV